MYVLIKIPLKFSRYNFLEELKRDFIFVLSLRRMLRQTNLTILKLKQKQKSFDNISYCIMVSGLL